MDFPRKETYIGPPERVAHDAWHEDGVHEADKGRPRCPAEVLPSVFHVFCDRVGNMLAYVLFRSLEVRARSRLLAAVACSGACEYRRRAEFGGRTRARQRGTKQPGLVGMPAVASARDRVGGGSCTIVLDDRRVRAESCRHED